MEMTAEEKRARRLLTWATLLATVGLIVLALDIMIKNAIVEAARDATQRAEQLRQSADRLAAASRPGPPGGRHGDRRVPRALIAGEVGDILPEPLHLAE